MARIQLITQIGPSAVIIGAHSLDRSNPRSEVFRSTRDSADCMTDRPRFQATVTNHSGRKLMSDDELRAELEKLRKENESLKKGAAKGVSMKVSEKGGLSVYGLGRFPITLYKEQWTKLLDMSQEIRDFIASHQSELKSKG
jgi:hypothetical protein